MTTVLKRNRIPEDKCSKERIVHMKRAIGIPALLALALASQVSVSQNYPTKPVHIVVPFTAGGLTDIMARAMVQDLTKAWGQPVIVDNRPGAGTRIGAEFVAKSAPDGHDIVERFLAVFASYLYSKLAYDPVRDFAPLPTGQPSVLVCGPGTQAKNLQEFIALARLGRARSRTVLSGSAAPPHDDRGIHRACRNPPEPYSVQGHCRRDAGGPERPDCRRPVGHAARGA
jgi:tripartite-type tricarboxylate transporter receptor subunit TctC